MSAFIVSHRHLAYLVNAGLLQGRTDYGPLTWRVPAPKREGSYQRGEPWGPEAGEDARENRRELTAATAGRVGAMLAAENVRSVNHRYDEAEDEGPYVHKRGAVIDAVQAIKAIDCYEYQSCEHPDWKESEAYAFCAALRHRMVKRIPGFAEAYEAAKWEIC